MVLSAARLNSTDPFLADPVLASAVMVILPFTISRLKPAGTFPTENAPEASITTELLSQPLANNKEVGVMEINEKKVLKKTSTQTKIYLNL